jgi:hypothetical protein
MSGLQEELNKELYLKLALEIEGMRFSPEIFDEALRRDPKLDVYHVFMDFSPDNTIGHKIPSHIRLRHGLGVSVRKNSDSPYRLKFIDGAIHVLRDEEVLGKIYFDKTPKYYDLHTSDGADMSTICQSRDLRFGDGVVFVVYSEECALSDKGHDCLFCNINATKARFSQIENHKWKYPRQIAETVKAAFAEGYDHFNITGGFVPERRELEYYIDVAEAIQGETGLEDFNGTAVIGAPADEVHILRQYREAGYRSIAIHPEVWGEDFFRFICPGKAEVNGGYHKYLEAIDAALEIFGKGRVRTQFVAGLQPKAQLLEGLEFFAEKGVVALANPWIPNIGSAFEGHRSPTVEWHWEVQRKNYEILRKNGITSNILYDCLPGSRLLMDFYRVDDGFFPVYPDGAEPESPEIRCTAQSQEALRTNLIPGAHL